MACSANNIVAPSVTTDIKLTLPFPPSVNHYWHSKIVKNKKGRPGRLQIMRYLSKRAKDFRADVQGCVFEQLGKAPRLKCGLAVIVHQHAGPGNVQDIDNGLKGLFDALEWAKVYVNDSQIDELLVIRKRRTAVARVDVILKPLGE